MLFQPPILTHPEKHPRALLHHNHVCPTYDMQRRCRIIRREEWVTKGVQELEAGDGHTEFPIQNIQDQVTKIIMGFAYNGGCGGSPSTRNGGYR
jgi:hypothetical protein